jgi:hypothetical protein
MLLLQLVGTSKEKPIVLSVGEVHTAFCENRSVVQKFEGGKHT